MTIDPQPVGTVEGTEEAARSHPFDQTGGIEDNYPDEENAAGAVDEILSGRDEWIAEHEIRISKETKLDSKISSVVLSAQ